MLFPWLQIIILKEQGAIPASGSSFAQDLTEFVRRYGFTLPDDMQAFYTRCRQASLFDAEFSLVPLSEMGPAGAALFGDEAALPPGWFAFGKWGEGDWIGLDLNQPHGVFPILDLDRYGGRKYQVIVLSFLEFLTDLLKLESEGIDGDVEETVYGLAIDHPSTEYLRRIHEREWTVMGPEQGPEPCRAPECPSLRIHLSIYCRKHHFEQLHHIECPFTMQFEQAGWAEYQQFARWED